MDRNLRRQAKSNKYKQTNIGGEREMVNEWVSERTNERASDNDNDHHLCRCICIHTYTYNVDGPQWQHQKPDINFICHRNSRAFLLFFILSLCVADENREFEFHSLWKINWNSDENYSIAVQLKLDKKYALINHVFRFQFFGVEKSNRPHNLENTNVPNITSFIQHTHSIVQALTLSTHTHAQHTYTQPKWKNFNGIRDCHSVHKFCCLLRSSGFVWKRFVSHSYAHLLLPLHNKIFLSSILLLARATIFVSFTHCSPHFRIKRTNWILILLFFRLEFLIFFSHFYCFDKKKYFKRFRYWFKIEWQSNENANQVCCTHSQFD